VIDWLVEERCRGVVDGNPYVDEVIEWRKEGRIVPLLKSTLRVIKKLKSKKYDLSIDLHGLFKSALFVFFANARYKIASSSTYGMRELSWILSKEIPPLDKDAHIVDRHLAVIRWLGGEVERRDFTIKIGEEDKRFVDELIGGISPFVVVHPGGGWKSRRWPPDRFSSLSDKIVEEGLTVVFVGGREGGCGEEGIVREIIQMAKRKERMRDLSGKLTLKQLAFLLKRAELFVGNEAGPMHIACAMEVPTVAIIGPTNPLRTGPYGEGKIAVVRKEISCSPCRERNCRRIECLKKISVEDVMGRILEILRN
jgi:lipopolysaccharide heptosyltransferase II